MLWPNDLIAKPRSSTDSTVPPELPEGYDGWGRQIIPGATKPPAPKKSPPAEALVPPAPGPIPPGGGYDYAQRNAPMTSMPGGPPPPGGPPGAYEQPGGGMAGGGGSGIGGPGGGMAMGMGGGSGVQLQGMSQASNTGSGGSYTMQTPTSAETGRPEQYVGFWAYYN